MVLWNHFDVFHLEYLFFVLFYLDDDNSFYAFIVSNLDFINRNQVSEFPNRHLRESI